MTKRHPERRADREDFIREIEDRQRNIVWPGPLANGRLVDKLVSKGSPDATVAQRVGIEIFGLSFLLWGSVFLSFANPCLLLGARVLYNAFRKRRAGGSPKQ